MSKKVSKLLVCVGVLIVAAAVALAGYNMYDNHMAGASVNAANDRMNHIIPGEEPEDRWWESIEEELLPDMPAMEIDGNRYIGQLRIPSLSLVLPVLSEWSYPLLRVAPCRFSGTVYDGSLTIAAHNYRTHFGRLTQLSQGDAIVFVDAEGYVWNYEVLEIVSVEPEEVEFMTTGDYWDLTLFTCNYSGQLRHAVRAVQVQMNRLEFP